MATGDGIWHRCHPILATFIGDYPEQSLVACTYNGRCPKCIVPRDELESTAAFPLRNFKTAMDIFALSDDDPTTFHVACQEANFKPTYHPFWQRLPFTDIFLSITPDILHQIHQGVTKHLVHWLARLGSEEINARCRRLPLNHNAQHFHKGITGLSRPTSREHKDICRILLGVAVDLPLPDNQSPARLNRAIRALLDFIYLSQYPLHTSETLNALDTALRRFHENKDVFIDLEVREHFNFPKLHSLVHYSKSISLFGAADNYNTEQSERLHIDFTKNAYRATNFKQEFQQMTTWLQRREAVDQHTAFLKWSKDGFSALPTPPSAYPSLGLTLLPFLATHPSEKGVTFERLSHAYGAIDFQDAIADFIVQHNFPELPASTAWRRANNTLLPFRRVSIFHKIKFTNRNLEAASGVIDTLHVRPSTCNRHGDNPGRFDTALVKRGAKYRVVQIRAVFQLPRSAASSIFLSSRPPPPTDLVYVEWFSPLSLPPDNSHGMYRVSRSHRNERRLASIIPLTDVCRSIQLFLAFGRIAPQDWQSSMVLEECRTFYVNPFLDRHLYYNINVIRDSL